MAPTLILSRRASKGNRERKEGEGDIAEQTKRGLSPAPLSLISKGVEKSPNMVTGNSLAALDRLLEGPGEKKGWMLGHLKSLWSSWPSAKTGNTAYFFIYDKSLEIDQQNTL